MVEEAEVVDIKEEAKLFSKVTIIDTTIDASIPKLTQFSIGSFKQEFLNFLTFKVV